jgi:hypothetical protein
MHDLGACLREAFSADPLMDFELLTAMERMGFPSAVLGENPRPIIPKK